MRHLASSSASCRRSVGLKLSRYDVLGSLRFGFRPDCRLIGSWPFCQQIKGRVSRPSSPSGQMAPGDTTVGSRPTTAAAFSRNREASLMYLRTMFADLWPLWAMIDRSEAPATAAAVTRPARRLWPAYSAESSPAASQCRLMMTATAPPERQRCILPWRSTWTNAHSGVSFEESGLVGCAALVIAGGGRAAAKLQLHN
jgi:hypothetical protein